MTESPAYSYRAQLLRVIDGDTVVLRVDVGFRMTGEMPIRLYGINCPEMNTVEGHAAREFTQSWMNERATPGVMLLSYKNPEKYGRWLGRVIDVTSGECLNDTLVAKGYAKAVDYGR